MFNPAAVTQTLRNIGERIESGNWDQAASHLEVFGMDFYRLLKPIEDPGKGPLRFIHPAEPFGVARVHETAAYVRDCEAAVSRRDLEAARVAIKAALARWDMGKGEW